MNPNYIHTLTLYNCLKAVHNPFKKDIWQKRILHNCFYKAVTAHTENNAQAGVSNTYVVRIPESEFYLPYREWSKLQDEERKHFFTLSIGDIIIYGECEEEINSDNIDNEDILFIDYMKKWLKMISASVEPTTLNGYQGVINGRMTDYFKNTKITLQNIKPKHIQEFYQYLLDDGLSGNTVKHYHANIRKALQYAMKTDIILSNPADKVDLPKIEEYKPKFYTSDEVKILLNEVIGTKLEIPVMIDCFYGFRRSEVIGLKWSAVDFENDTITIDHTITQSSGKLIIRDKTKTKSSFR